MKGITRRQQDVLDYITAYIGKAGYPPTIREIGKFMGIRSTNGVNDHLKALERKGLLKRDDLKSRAMRPMKPGDRDEAKRAPDLSLVAMPLSGELVDIPVLGKVAAGAPILAYEDPAADRVYVDRLLIGNTREIFALRVTGESMIEDGILDGDYVFVQKTPAARAGEIVVALIGDDVTVKRFYPEGDRVRFQPANAAMQPIYVHRDEFRETSIMGRVVGMYRKV